jgi:hypothetical protein
MMAISASKTKRVGGTGRISIYMAGEDKSTKKCSRHYIHYITPTKTHIRLVLDFFFCQNA